MRGRRHKLQVSTFPFLAVLLCAMGSLILILLVMDRKAHRAAVARAQQRAAKLVEESARSEAERARIQQQAQAEHERKREEMHAQLTNEQIAMQLQMRKVREQLQQIAARLHYEQDTSTELRRKVQEKRGQLQADEQLLLTLHAHAQQTENQSKESNQTLHRMTLDLLRMEQALKDLKASQKREQKSFSVVPYHGRRGENRRPIYIECFEDGVVFHPERKAMPLRALMPAARDPSGGVRGEVERRIAVQRAKLAKLPGKEEQIPYLLLLVRPNGVHTYHHFQAALRGLELELQFGYEFIDDDWVLDFPTDDEMPSAQPWMIATKTPARSAPAVAVPPLVKPMPHPIARTSGGSSLMGFAAASGGNSANGSMGMSSSSGSGVAGVGGNGSFSPASVANSGTRGGFVGARGNGGNAVGGGEGGGSGDGFVGGTAANAVASTGEQGQGTSLFPGGIGGSGTGSPASSTTGGSRTGVLHGAIASGEGSGGGGYPSSMPSSALGTSSEARGYSGERLPIGGGFRGFGRAMPGATGSGIPSSNDGSGAGGGSDQPGGGGGNGFAGSGTTGSGRGVGGLGFPSSSPGGAYGQGGSSVGGTGLGSGGSGNGVSTQGNAGIGGMASGGVGSGNGSPGNGGSASGVPGSAAFGSGSANNGMAASGSASNGVPNEGRTVIASASNEGNGSASGGSASGGGANGTGSGGEAGASSGNAGDSSGFDDNIPGQEKGGTASKGGRATDRVIYLDPATGQPIKPPPSSPQADEQPPPDEPSGNRGPPRVHVVVGNGGGGGEPVDPQSQAMNRFAPTPTSAPPRRRPVVPRPGWVHGGRDWIIYLECRNEGVVLYPLERTFPLAEATREPSSNNLIKTIQQMIDRRQSARRPEEPPYHPQLCLLVRPEHIRTYLTVSSALQALPIPKTRRNLDDDDDIIGIVTGSTP
jgi:hypothetical protein